jgi:hypothetical protein
MPIIASVPRDMLEKKPRHGSPCNRCGLCCYSSLCELGRLKHGLREGPCPELRWDADGSRCGLIDDATGELREAAKLLLNTGNGCDMLLHGEHRNHRYTAQRDTFDRHHRAELAAARRLWEKA